MQRKFEARKVEDLPEPARAAESWSEAFELVPHFLKLSWERIWEQ